MSEERESLKSELLKVDVRQKIFQNSIDLNSGTFKLFEESRIS